MKPCPHMESDLIAWISDDLTPDRKLNLASHLEQCPGCRGYAACLQDMIKECRQLKKEAQKAALPAGFHARLMQRLKLMDTRSQPGWLEVLKAWWTLPRLAVCLSLLLAGLLLISNPMRPLYDPSGSTQTQSRENLPNHKTWTSTAPYSLLSYQQALRVSPEELEKVITQQARRDSGAEGVTWLQLMLFSI